MPMPTAEAATIVDNSYWPASQYQNDLIEVSAASNKPCTPASIILTPSSMIKQACVVHAAWGEITDDGYVRFTGDGSFQNVPLPNGETVLPVANTSRLYAKIPTGTAGQFKVGYYDADYIEALRLSALQPVPDTQPTILGYTQSTYFGDIQQTVTVHEDLVWKNVGFSPNGEWMVGVILQARTSGYCTDTTPDRYCDIAAYTNVYARVRLGDGAVGGFGTADGKQVGGLTLGVSNDGEAAAVTGWNYWKLDLFTFPYGASLDTRYFGVDREVLRVFDDKGVGGKYVSNAFFSVDNQYLYYNVRHANPDRTDLMRLWPSAGDPPATIDNYLALGDSFSSGEGEYSYRPETNFYKSSTEYNLCHQSQLSYGYLLNATIIPDAFGSVACSGAKMQDISFSQSNSQQTYEKNPQAKGISYNINEAKIKSLLLPGYIDQRILLDYTRPSVATISVGGNDAGFSNVVKACVLNKVIKPYVTKKGDVIPRTCYDNRDQREQLANSIDAQIPQLTKTFEAVRSGMSGDQRLYVVGYPQAISPDFTVRCDIGTPVAWSERQFLVNFTYYLNEAIRLAAINAGAVFVDTSNAFVDGSKDYRLCGNQGESAMNDVERNGKSSRKPDDKISKESFHPTLFGHILMTRQIRQQTNDLTRPMNDPLPAEEWSTRVDDGYRTQLVGDADKKTGKKTMPQENIAPDTLYKTGAKNSVQIVQYDAAGNAHAVLFSDPVELGPLQVGPDGTISGDIVIPDDVPTGYHQLHIIYSTASGEEKDVYQYVFVGEKPDDLNGDGTSDSQQSCIFETEPSMDLNGDGAQNGCVLSANDITSDTQSPGNNLETLVSSGAITPAEAVMVRAVQSGAKPKRVAEPMPEAALTVPATYAATTQQKSQESKHTNAYNPKPSATAHTKTTQKKWRMVAGAVLVLLALLAGAILLRRAIKRK